MKNRKFSILYRKNKKKIKIIFKNNFLKKIYFTINMDDFVDFLKTELINYEENPLEKKSSKKKKSKIKEGTIEDIFEKEDNEWKPHFTRRFPKTISNISSNIEEWKDKYGEYFPENEKLFYIFRRIKPSDVKIVIVGQDPYPQKIILGGKEECRARGYCFGVHRKDEVPVSLKNIYKGIKEDFPYFDIPTHGDLECMIDQGVLFLNASLTYFPNAKRTCNQVWVPFVSAVIDILNEESKNCIYVLWGKDAQKLEYLLKERNIVRAAHPSGFSAHRGFFGQHNFLLINKKLHEQGKDELDWSKLNGENKTPTTLKNLKRYLKNN